MMTEENQGSFHPVNREAERQQKEAELKFNNPEMFKIYRRYCRTLSHDDAIEFLDTDFDEAPLSIALACLNRLVHLWGFVATGFIKQRYPDDERHYQMLRSNIFLQLRSSPDYADLERYAHEAIPQTLPTISEMIDMVDIPEIEFSIDNNFRQIEAEMIRRAIDSWIDLDVDRFDPLLAIHDRYIDDLQSAPNDPLEGDVSTQDEGGPNDDSPSRDSPQSSRPGRPRTEIPYEAVQRIYQDMADDDEYSASPAYKEIIERLKSENIWVSMSTFKDRVREWKAQGVWPPRISSESEP